MEIAAATIHALARDCACPDKERNREDEVLRQRLAAIGLFSIHSLQIKPYCPIFGGLF